MVACSQENHVMSASDTVDLESLTVVCVRVFLDLGEPLCDTTDYLLKILYVYDVSL